jgi:hypothetical protein
MLATGSKVRGGVEGSDDERMNEWAACPGSKIPSVQRSTNMERQVWNVYAPVFKLLLKMCFETETVCATGVARKETLVVFPVVFESNVTPYLEERGEQG